MKVVMTGGPCAGKSSLISRFAELESISVVHEAATHLWALGWQQKGQECGYSSEWKIAFQVAVLETQLTQEELATKKQSRHVICDRGISDGPAYLNDVPAVDYEPRRFLASYGDAPGQYHLIIHLTSLALTQPNLYGNQDNQFRTESLDDACRLDELIWKAWESTSISQIRINTDKPLSSVFEDVLAAIKWAEELAEIR